MYGRDYAGQRLSFEASGGLLNASLVLRDRETDTLWSIMTGRAESGELHGLELDEQSGAEKISWRDWRTRHPDTRVLSIDGVEHTADGYARYFRSPLGFDGATAEDGRLATKEPVFAGRSEAGAWAVPLRAVEGGGVVDLGGERLFLHRPPGPGLERSTAAFRSAAGFERRDDVWIETASGAVFDPAAGTFRGGAVERHPGFDTYWYIWSAVHPEVRLLVPEV